MALPKYFSIQEQNANSIAGAQIDGSTYASSVTLRYGREAPFYTFTAVQTASLLNIVLDVFNAQHGATIVVKRATASSGTCIFNIVSGSAAGQLVATAIATSIPYSAEFDGNAYVWR